MLCRTVKTMLTGSCWKASFLFRKRSFLMVILMMHHHSNSREQRSEEVNEITKPCNKKNIEEANTK